MKERIDGRRADDEVRLSSRAVGLLAGVLLLMSVAAGMAQSKQTDSLSKRSDVIVTRDDRAPVRVRYPFPDHVRDLQTDRDYQYGRDVVPPENPLARFWQWLMSKIGDFLSSEAYQNVWQYVLLAVIAGIAIYLLMKAEVLGFLFPKKAQLTGLAYEELDENIHEIDFASAVEEAVGQRNFRLAVRLLYLQTLKQLTDAGRIQYKPDKTNRQYVNELANSLLRPDFERLTRQFEFVWYGDFPIDEAHFAALRSDFTTFNKAGKQGVT